ncbi:MAG: protein kinase [Enhygromyxa sp.]
MAQLIDLGGGPVNRSEREIIELLIRDLPGGWSIAPNANLPDPRTGHPYEYDVIVIGPHAIYVVEIKGWRGQIRQLNRHEWQLSGGEVVRNPLPLLDHKARVLASEVRRLGWSGTGPPYVQGCLVAGSNRVDYSVNDVDTGRCLRRSELITYLRDPQRLSTDRTPVDFRRQHKRLVQLVRGQFEGRPESPRRYGSYLAIDLQERDEESAVWLGRHALLDDGRVYRIRAWYLSEYRYTPEQRTERLRVLRRNADALHKVGEHPCIAQLRDFGERDGKFYEVTDWTNQGTLKTARDRGVLDKLGDSEKLSILRDVVRGLEAAAAHDIIHRSLSPKAVLLTADGHARICDFDRAWLIDSTQTVYGATLEVNRKYLPPELRDNLNYDVFDNSDLYSLGKIARFLFADRVPLAISDLIDRCLHDEPSERPDGPTAFLREFDAATVLAEPPATPNPAPAATPSPASRPHLVSGDVIDGVNMILEEIGRSENSTVYRVDNEPLGEIFALKLVYAPPTGYDPMEEFRLLRNLDSVHIPRAHWCGRTSFKGGAELAYLLLDYVEGTGLRELIEGGPLELDRALDLIDDLLEALEALHGLEGDGALHRDVKPENVVVGPEGAVLLDFGIARPTTGAGATPSGTLRYTPPDLAESGWEPAADLFAVGCIAYEMLTCSAPWSGLATSESPQPLCTRNRTVADAISTVVAQSLAPRAADRYPDATSMRAALRNARHPELQAGANSNAPEQEGDERDLPVADVSLWTAARLQALTEHHHLQVPLAAALIDCVVEPVDESPEAVQLAMLASEARAQAFEAPLVEAMPSAYSLLGSEIYPLPVDCSPEDENAAPAAIKIESGDRVLRCDGLHFSELRLVEYIARQFERNVRAWVWCAGPIDPTLAGETNSAFARAISGGDVAQVPLERGDRDAMSLATTLCIRRKVIEEQLLLALERPGNVWVASAWGTIYFGHGLRIDPGEGFGDRADTIRKRWSGAFPSGRVAPNEGGSLPRDTPFVRVNGDRKFVVGRLAWPDRPGTSWLQDGGLSLPERLLILIRISRGPA